MPESIGMTVVKERCGIDVLDSSANNRIIAVPIMIKNDGALDPDDLKFGID